MSEIRIKCIDQVLIVENTPDIASGDRNVDRVVFDLCPKWDGYTPVGVFYNDPEKVYPVLLDENLSAYIPAEVMSDQTTLFIGVMGVKDDSIRTSNLVRYRINKGALAGSAWIENPSPTLFEQLVTTYAEILEKLSLIQVLTVEEVDAICNGTYVETLDDTNLSPVLDIDEIPVEDVAKMCV